MTGAWKKSPTDSFEKWRNRGRLPTGKNADEYLRLLESTDKLAYLETMTLMLPDRIERCLSPESTALHLAIGLFVTEEATLGQAAEVAGVSQTEFLRELGRHHIPIHYGAEELAEDWRTVEALARQ